MSEVSHPSRHARTVDQDVLALLDHALPFVLILKLSGAWLYPSFIPSDAAPGVGLLNAVFLAFCLYGTIRLLFTRSLALVFAEPGYFLLLIMAALSLVASVSLSNSFGMLRTAGLFFGSCIFLRYRFSAPHLLQLFALSMGVLMLLSVLAALATPLGIMAGFDAGRWRGVFNHKNTLGENAALTLVVAGGLVATRAWRSYLPGLVAVLAGVCLVLSGSATALAAAAAGALALALALVIVRLRIVPRQGLGLLLVLILGAALASSAIIAPLAAALGRDLTFTGRTEIWEQFFHFAQQRPWTGWGWATISTTTHMLPLIRQTLGLPFIQTPHSGYLSLLVELGYPGLLLFVGWLGHVVLGASRRAVLGRDRFAMLRLGITCALVVHALFESTSGALPSLWLLLLFATNERVAIRWR